MYITLFSIHQQRPNFRIAYFAPPNAAPCTMPLGADAPPLSSPLLPAVSDAYLLKSNQTVFVRSYMCFGTQDIVADVPEADVGGCET